MATTASESFGYVLPPEYHILERDERSLFIDPLNHIWFATDNIGKRCLLAYSTAHSIEDASHAVAEAAGLPADDLAARDYARQFLTNLVGTGFLHEQEYERQVPSPAPLAFPQVMYIHLTASCNLKCTYCYNQDHRFNFLQEIKKEASPKPKMATRTQKFLDILDEAASFGLKEVKLTGGEATLYKDFMVIARHAKELGLFVNLLTNGGLINEGNAADVVACVDSVSVSLDSASADGGHDAVRGKGTHQKALDAIAALRKAGLQYLHVNGVVTPTTLQTMEELLDFAHGTLHADRTTLAGSAIQVTDPNKRWNADEHMLSADQFADFEKRQYEYYRSKAQSHDVGYRNQCGVGNGVISLDPNGDVYPCQTLHEPEFLIGNAFEGGLSTLMVDSKQRDKTRLATVDQIPECNVCPVRYICSSGCRSEAYTREGDILARNKDLCPTFFEIAQNKLWDSVAVSA